MVPDLRLRLSSQQFPNGVLFAAEISNSPPRYPVAGHASAQKAVDAVHGMMAGEHALLGLALGET